LCGSKKWQGDVCRDNALVVKMLLSLHIKPIDFVLTVGTDGRIAIMGPGLET